ASALSVCYRGVNDPSGWTLRLEAGPAAKPASRAQGVLDASEMIGRVIRLDVNAPALSFALRCVDTDAMLGTLAFGITAVCVPVSARTPQPSQLGDESEEEETRPPPKPTALSPSRLQLASGGECVICVSLRSYGCVACSVLCVWCDNLHQ
ncbi:MAG: hypothetical protein P4L40_22565, partial [Terracidiphilus sp.]|nr:hypothetical protein [Terracidiphilus sp.]